MQHTAITRCIAALLAFIVMIGAAMVGFPVYADDVDALSQTEAVVMDESENQLLDPPSEPEAEPETGLEDELVSEPQAELDAEIESEPDAKSGEEIPNEPEEGSDAQDASDEQSPPEENGASDPPADEQESPEPFDVGEDMEDGETTEPEETGLDEPEEAEPRFESEYDFRSFCAENGRTSTFAVRSWHEASSTVEFFDESYNRIKVLSNSDAPTEVPGAYIMIPCAPEEAPYALVRYLDLDTDILLYVRLYTDHEQIDLDSLTGFYYEITFLNGDDLNSDAYKEALQVDPELLKQLELDPLSIDRNRLLKDKNGDAAGLLAAGDTVMTFKWNGTTYTMTAGQSGSATGIRWTCNADGTFTMDFLASGTFRVTSGSPTGCSVLVIGGGAGGSSAYGATGGGRDGYGGNGGGGGQAKTSTVSIAANTDYTVTVGAGGAGGSANLVEVDRRNANIYPAWDTDTWWTNCEPNQPLRMATVTSQGTGGAGGQSAFGTVTANGGTPNAGGTGAPSRGPGGAAAAGSRAGGGGGAVSQFGEAWTVCEFGASYACWICCTDVGWSGYGPNYQSMWSPNNGFISAHEQTPLGTAANEYGVGGGTGNLGGGKGGTPETIHHCTGTGVVNGRAGTANTGGGGGGGAFCARAFRLGAGISYNVGKDINHPSQSSLAGHYAGSGGAGGSGIVTLTGSGQAPVGALTLRKYTPPGVPNSNFRFTVTGPYPSTAVVWSGRLDSHASCVMHHTADPNDNWSEIVLTNLPVGTYTITESNYATMYEQYVGGPTSHTSGRETRIGVVANMNRRQDFYNEPYPDTYTSLTIRKNLPPGSTGNANVFGFRVVCEDGTVVFSDRIDSPDTENTSTDLVNHTKTIYGLLVGPLYIVYEWNYDGLWIQYTGTAADHQEGRSQVKQLVSGSTTFFDFYNEKYGFNISLTKSSSDPSISNNNTYGQHSLKGAVYGVYDSDACTNLLETITTNASGYAATSNLYRPGLYYIKEITPPKGFKLDTRVHTMTVATSGTITADVAFDEEPIQFYPIPLQKTSAWTEATNGNSLYSLAGAVYGIYSDSACTNELDRVTTNASGQATSKDIFEASHTYYIKEITASPGYLLDTAVHTVTTNASGTATISPALTEVPAYTNTDISIRKIDENGNLITAGEAVFKVEYFMNYTATGTATRTWYYKTKNGVCNFPRDLSYLDTSRSNSARYVSPQTSKASIPLGSLRITEVSAPTGYQLSSEVLTGTVTQPSNGAAAVWTWTCGTNTYVQYTDSHGVLNLVNAAIPSSLSIQKKTSNANFTSGNSCYSLAGAVYGIYSNSACTTELERITTNNVGGASATNTYGNGTYYIKEISPSMGYKLSSTKHKVTVSGGTVTYSPDNFTETPVFCSSEIQITKTTNNGGTTITSGTAVFKVEFFANNSWSGSATRTWYYKTVNGVCVLLNDTYLDTTKTNSNRYHSNNLNKDVFPLGTVKITEVEAPDGYTATSAVIQARVTQDTTGGDGVWHWVTADGGQIHYTSATSAALQVDNAPQIAISIDKTSTNTDLTNGHVLYSLAGAVYGIYSDYACTSLITSITTDASGNAASSAIFDAGQTYYIKETTASPGYLLDNHVHTATTSSAGAVTISPAITEIPATTAADITIRKVDKNGNLISTENAVFKVEYFENNDWSGTAARTWYYKTVNGICAFPTDESYLDTSRTNSARYTSCGTPVIPLGTIQITEVAAPTGYQASSQVLRGSVTQPSNGAAAVWTWTTSTNDVVHYTDSHGALELINEYVPTILHLRKTSSSTEITNGNSLYSVAGAVYGLYSDNLCTDELERVTTNTFYASFVNSYDPGTYYIKEISASPGYLLDTAVHAVTISLSATGASTTKTVSYTEVPTALDTSIQIIKTTDNGATTITSGEAVFKVEYFQNATATDTATRTWYYKTINGVCQLMDESYLDTTKTNGARYTLSGRKVIPLGSIKITEVSAPAGYQTSSTVVTARITQDETGGPAVLHWITEDGGTVHYNFNATGFKFDNESANSTLTIEKNVTGNLGSRIKSFNFSVTLTDADGSALSGSYPYTGSKSGTLTLNASGAANFTLRHGEHITISEVPIGSRYTVTEANYVSDGYYTTSSGSTGTIVAAGNTASFTNNYNAIVPTGVETHIIPGIFSMGIASGAALVLKLKHRRREKDED